MSNFCVTFKRRSGLEKHYSVIRAGTKQVAEMYALLRYGTKLDEVKEEKSFDPSFYTSDVYEVLEAEEYNELTNRPHDLPEDF